MFEKKDHLLLLAGVNRLLSNYGGCLASYGQCCVNYESSELFLNFL